MPHEPASGFTYAHYPDGYRIEKLTRVDRWSIARLGNRLASLVLADLVELGLPADGLQTDELWDLG